MKHEDIDHTGLTGVGGGGGSEEWWHDSNAPGSPDADNREFVEGTTIGTLTRVAHGTPKGTWAEVRGGLEWTQTVTIGTEMDVYAIARTISIGDYITVACRTPQVAGNMGIFVGFADGTTFGTSDATGCDMHISNLGFGALFYYRTLLNSWPNFNSRAVDGTAYDALGAGVIGIRVKYIAANTWALYVNINGLGWRAVQVNHSVTLTPTHAVFGIHSISGLAYAADNGVVMRLECVRFND